ncbi:MAG: hypothetical protein JSV06_07810 [Myxococcales bacterium]|nr:MAG: hypothetical protein JSV06_07810 [Myxococcales bacterium]
MSDSEQTKFETVRQGCVRFVPSLEVLLARWAEGCDHNPHTSAPRILKASGYKLSFVDGQLRVDDFACPSCAAELVAERDKPPRPACYAVGGDYRPDGSNPRSIQCEACRAIMKPSALVEHLHPSKPKRQGFLETHCRGARPQEKRWVVARHEGKAATAEVAEDAIDRVIETAYPPEIELCLVLAIEQPLDAASLDLPFLQVPLSARGEVKTLGWHGERPTVNEQARYQAWHRVAVRERQQEIERRTRLATAEPERELVT